MERTMFPDKIRIKSHFLAEPGRKEKGVLGEGIDFDVVQNS